MDQQGQSYPAIVPVVSLGVPAQNRVVVDTTDTIAS
jgi:hypothetical protein